MKLLPVVLIVLMLSALPALAQNHARFKDIKPGMVDEDLEYHALKRANQWAIDTRCEEEYTKAIILSKEWEPYYDKFGDYAGRQVLMELYCIRGYERCGIVDFTFREKYLDDGSYSRKLKCKRMGIIVNIDCE